ncbi:MAG TPA: acetate--CoA ligase family protein [Acidimicrobiales bacterium]|nr:acetate--CoA ligase family protein [Acidimicrobiales bacterium]
MLAEAIFYPENMAIVGASPRPGNWSGHVMESLRLAGYPGAIFPVNPRYEEVWGLPSFASLTDIPVRPDQVLVLVPAEHVSGVLTEATGLGARSAIIYTSGFGEDQSPAAQSRNEVLRSVVRESGMAVLGPNCLGYASYPSRAFALTNGATDAVIENGSVAVVAQSGGVALYLHSAMLLRNLGPRYIASSGNEVGLCLEDYLDYFISDESVKTIGAFIETVKDVDRFLALAQKAAKLGKPIVAVKMGGSEGSRRAAVAHTGRLAGSGRAFHDVAQEHGVIVVKNSDEMVDVFSMLASGVIPKSRRCGGITVSGGLKGILLDSSDRNGLTMPDLAPETLAKASALMGVGTAVGNPLDTGFTGLSDKDALHALMSLVASDPNVDNLIVQQRLPESDDDEDLISALQAASKAAELLDGVTVVTEGFMTSTPSASAFRRLAEFKRLCFAHSAERAMEALSHLVQYSETLSETNASNEASTVQAETKKRISLSSVPNPDLLIDELAVKRVLQDYGLRIPEIRTCDLNEDGSVPTLDPEPRFPFVIKAVASGVTHKSELGLVSSLVLSDAQFRSEYKRIVDSIKTTNIDASSVTMTLEEGILGGIECVIGFTRDPELGDLVMFGSGGLGVELYDDVAFALASSTPAELGRMIRRTQVGQLLAGGRGRKYDVSSVLDALVGIRNFVADAGRAVESVELNPIIVRPEGQGVFVLDAALVHAS